MVDCFIMSAALWQLLARLTVLPGNSAAQVADHAAVLLTLHPSHQSQLSCSGGGANSMLAAFSAAGISTVTPGHSTPPIPSVLAT